MYIRNFVKVELDTYYTTTQLGLSLLFHYIQLVLNGKWLGLEERNPDLIEDPAIMEYFEEVNIADIQIGDVYYYIKPSIENFDWKHDFGYGIVYTPDIVCYQPNYTSVSKEMQRLDIIERLNLKVAHNFKVVVLRPLNDTYIFLGNRESVDLDQDDTSHLDYPNVDLVRLAIQRGYQYRGDFSAIADPDDPIPDLPTMQNDPLFLEGWIPYNGVVVVGENVTNAYGEKVTLQRFYRVTLTNAEGEPVTGFKYNEPAHLTWHADAWLDNVDEMLKTSERLYDLEHAGLYRGSFLFSENFPTDPTSPLFVHSQIFVNDFVHVIHYNDEIHHNADWTFEDEVATYQDLPATATEGHAYYVDADDMFYIWRTDSFQPQGQGYPSRPARFVATTVTDTTVEFTFDIYLDEKLPIATPLIEGTMKNDGTTLQFNASHQLYARAATETETGIAEIATQAEVDAGISTTTIVTPATLKKYIDMIVNIGSRLGDIESAIYGWANDKQTPIMRGNMVFKYSPDNGATWPYFMRGAADGADNIVRARV